MSRDSQNTNQTKSQIPAPLTFTVLAKNGLSSQIVTKNTQIVLGTSFLEIVLKHRKTANLRKITDCVLGQTNHRVL